MFEGKPPKSQHCAVSGRGPADGDLREISWSDLRARLEASRDLRSQLHADEDIGLTSFDAHSARHIAAMGDGKGHVNPADLANGKEPDSMNGAAGRNDMTGRDPRE